MHRIVILGAGGHGRIAAEIAELTGWKEIVFLDPKWRENPLSGVWPVIDDDRDDVLLSQPTNSFFFAGIGDNARRAGLQMRLEKLGLPMAKLVSPNAVVSKYAELAPGCLISAGAVVSVGVRVARGAIVNTCACVDHDSVVGPFSHVAPGAHLAADVTLGEGSLVGIGANVRNGISIGAHATVGAGATVVSMIAAHRTVVGTPAKPI